MKQNAYFCGIRNEILKVLANAQKDVRIAMAWFTNNDLMNALLDCINRGIKVELVLMDDIINNCDFGVDFNVFIEAGGVFHLYPKSIKMMHNKFCVVDENIIITGSYNWTNYAESRNKENIVISNDETLVKSYLDCFTELFTQSQRCSSFEVIPVGMIERSVFTNRAYDIACEIYSTPDCSAKSMNIEFENRLKECGVELSKESIDMPIVDSKPALTPQVIQRKVEDFRYAVSKYNIGFKANLKSKNMQLGLKIMIEKGQELPCTIKHEAESANDGNSSDASANSVCEVFYGSSDELSQCTKFGKEIKLENLPVLEKGKVKFKVFFTLKETGELSVKFMCLNNNACKENIFVDKDFVEYKN